MAVLPSSDLPPLLPSPLLASVTPFSSPLRGWLTVGASRGQPAHFPPGLQRAALEQEAPRPSGSLTCPWRGAGEVRVALLGERGGRPGGLAPGPVLLLQ